MTLHNLPIKLSAERGNKNVVPADVLGTGVDAVATRDMPAAK